MHDVVVVEISDQLAAGVGERDVAGRADAAALAAKAADARVVEAAEQRRGPVDTAVIDDQQLPGTIGLVVHRGDGALQQRAAIARRQHDREQRRGPQRRLPDPIHDRGDLKMPTLLVEQCLQRLHA